MNNFVKTPLQEKEFWKWIEKSGIDVRFVEINSLLANKILIERNTHNRPFYDSTDEAYASDMAGKKWEVTHQGIAFDKNGVLLDGQQRLQSIVWSGKTITLLVTKGLDPESQFVMDSGRNRKIGDQGTLMYGWENGNLRSAIIRMLALLWIRTGRKVTNSQTKEISDIYDEEINLILKNRHGSISSLIYAPVLGALCFAAKVSREKVIEFEKNYFNGENLQEGSPILRLRVNMINRRNGGKKQTRKESACITLNALMQYIINPNVPIKRIQNNNVGYDFFANKQPKINNQIKDLFKY